MKSDTLKNKYPVLIEQKRLFISMLYIILLFFIISTSFVIAQKGDLTISLNQSEYYFKIGENAVIKLESDNTYGSQIDATLSYTITQSVNQGNFQYSSTNTKSVPFLIDKDKIDNSISFGTSKTPLILSVNLKISYDKDGPRVININDIKIHFVDDESQKQNNNDDKGISKSSEASSKISHQQDPFAQQQQEMQKMINQMFGNQQPSQQQKQSPEQKLQNNQLSQDSSALKKQMQKQIEEQEAIKQEFQRELASNKNFQQEHQNLIKKGYNLSGANINPINNNTGDFELNYENKNGDKASLKGHMINGSIKNIQKNTPENRQHIREILEKNKDFQKYQKELKENNFNEQNFNTNQILNETDVKVTYLNRLNETASINAKIVNDSVEKIELISNLKKENKNNLWILFVLILSIILAYFYYKKTMRKKDKKEIISDTKKVEKYYDYKLESLNLLENAKNLFKNKKYKDAYGCAGQALRLYLSYENNLKKEVTNDEIINFLRVNKKPFKNTKDCFDLCSLVEFAKYKENKEDFDKIIKHTFKIINK